MSRRSPLRARSPVAATLFLLVVAPLSLVALTPAWPDVATRVDLRGLYRPRPESLPDWARAGRFRFARLDEETRGAGDRMTGDGEQRQGEHCPGVPQGPTQADFIGVAQRFEGPLAGPVETSVGFAFFGFHRTGGRRCGRK